MKKILLAMLLFGAIVFNSQAQGNPCGCVPTTTPQTYTYENPLCGTIEVEFTIVQCGSTIGILFNQGMGLSPSGIGVFTTGYHNPSNNGCNFTVDYKKAQEEILDIYGAGANVTFTYPAACNAIVSVDYGNITCYSFPQEGPQTGQAIPYTVGIVDQTVTCNSSSCCATEWAFNAATNKYRQLPGNPVVICDGTQPDLTQRFKFECLDRNGKTQKFIGTPKKIVAPCYSYCDPINSAVMLKTSVQDAFKLLPDPTDITVQPIPAKEQITFSETKNMTKINVFDVNGKKVLEKTTFEGNDMDISQLSAGVHFVHIHFNNASLRTVKIIKE